MVEVPRKVVVDVNENNNAPVNFDNSIFLDTPFDNPELANKNIALVQVELDIPKDRALKSLNLLEEREEFNNDVKKKIGSESKT